MSASLFVIATGVACRGAQRQDGTPDVAHAVARPVVDGLDSSVCGVLVAAAAATDWQDGRELPRCPECARIVG